jgi:hypothetical protein
MTYTEALNTLGLNPNNINLALVKKTYRELAKIYAPDLNPGIDPQILARINIAYEIVIENLTAKQRDDSPPEPAKKKSPKLKLEPKYIRFGNMGFHEIKTTYFDIINMGGPHSECDICYEELPRWLRITDVKPLSDKKLPVRITIEATGQDLGSTYEFDLPVKISNTEINYTETEIVHIELVMKRPILNVPIKRAIVNIGTNRSNVYWSEELILRNTGYGYCKVWIKSDNEYILFRSLNAPNVKKYLPIESSFSKEWSFLLGIDGEMANNAIKKRISNIYIETIDTTEQIELIIDFPQQPATVTDFYQKRMTPKVENKRTNPQPPQKKKKSWIDKLFGTNTN